MVRGYYIYLLCTTLSSEQSGKTASTPISIDDCALATIAAFELLLKLIPDGVYDP